MLSVTHHWGKAPPNHSKLSPHTCQNGRIKTTTQVLARCGEKGTLAHVWWGYNPVQLLGKTGWRVLNKIKDRTVRIQQFDFWVFIRRKGKHYLEKYLHAISLKPYSQQPDMETT